MSGETTAPRAIALPPFGGVSPPSLRRLRPVILPIATAAAVLLLWQIACALFHVPHVILPPPSEIAAELWHILPLLLHQAVPTTLDSLTAFAVATVLGVALAIAVTYSPLIRDTFYPNLVAFQLVPKVALAPLFVVWFGITSESRVAFPAFTCFFPVVISSVVGFSRTDSSTLRLCRSLTASDWQSFMLVRFPFALPAIQSLRAALSHGRHSRRPQRLSAAADHRRRRVAVGPRRRLAARLRDLVGGGVGAALPGRENIAGAAAAAVGSVGGAGR
jgi:ABC-type nitrate/sulfonate/bicarbonate transport system permease component